MDLKDILALVWKRRWVALGVLVMTLVASAPAHPLAADRVRVDRRARAHARRAAGPGARRLRQPVRAAEHLRRDREVERQPRARRGGARPQRSRRTSTPRRRRGTGILRITARDDEPARGRGGRAGGHQGLPGVDRRQQAGRGHARRPGLARTSPRSSRARRCCSASRPCSACSPAACWRSRWSSSAAASRPPPTSRATRPPRCSAGCSASAGSRAAAPRWSGVRRARWTSRRATARCGPTSSS